MKHYKGTYKELKYEHGRWIYYGDLIRDGFDYLCSNCCERNDFASRFCPNCGAKMDKKLPKEKRNA